MPGDQFEEAHGVSGLPHHVVPEPLAQAGEPLAKQHVVVGEDDPFLCRPLRCVVHGPGGLG
ncbi:hypothetical protein [Streptomyces gilvus]|uniref:hypothetical protein n=1 Tax=Streptomyces gilvus TaxID=2920937 RepID=UPI001F0FFC8F|nr:hypothetical protein [Streptomyces sp. CME 23]MCH5673181.1 hypothetical protein [Streptomyces sp. CME 23]